VGYSFHEVIWEARRDKRCGRSEPFRPWETEGCDHSSDFIVDTSIDFEEEEEVDSCPNHNRNQGEDDVVERYEQFVDKDKESHDCRGENDVEDRLFLDFDRYVALEEVSD